MKIIIINSAGTYLEEGVEYELTWNKHLRHWEIIEEIEGEIYNTYVNDLFHDGVEFKAVATGGKNED